MSILIKNMAMPKNCYDCACSNYYESIDEAMCDITDEWLDYTLWKSGRHPDCPLVEIPATHGRLIDIDDAIESYGGNAELEYVSQAKFLNVIIEAEGEG